MSNDSVYDVIIIGGGLAGLASAILLARKNYSVIVLEKESYPKHKVCGEYISMESKPFLEDLGLQINNMQLPIIDTLQLTDSRGNELTEHLPEGGFGISRYKLDALLANIAEDAGATIYTKTRANDIAYLNDLFTVKASNKTFSAKVVCGTWGKRSNIDVKWERSFIKEKNKALNNYIAVKYHVSYPWPGNYIGLHNFSNGYCGISQIEDNKCCVCYLTTAATLHKSENNVKKLERDVVMKNPWLSRIFSNAGFLYQSPVTISQISFDKKEQVHEHVLLLGDAAGMITPLCGNGMSMAFHSAKIAGGYIDDYLAGRITRNDMEKNYTQAWKKIFSTRITLGRIVQGNFGKDRTTSYFIKIMKFLPFLRKALIRGTRGKPF
jgi:flavin-dependent dehydrogenase